jgi:hypothetical protein
MPCDRKHRAGDRDRFVADLKPGGVVSDNRKLPRTLPDKLAHHPGVPTPVNPTTIRGSRWGSAPPLHSAQCLSFGFCLPWFCSPHHVITAVDIDGIPVDHASDWKGEEGYRRPDIGDGGKLVLRRPLRGFG